MLVVIYRYFFNFFITTKYFNLDLGQITQNSENNLRFTKK